MKLPGKEERGDFECVLSKVGAEIKYPVTKIFSDQEGSYKNR